MSKNRVFGSRDDRYGPRPGDLTTPDYINFFETGNHLLTLNPVLTTFDDWGSTVLAWMHKRRRFGNVWLDHGDGWFTRLDPAHAMTDDMEDDDDDLEA
jgi:hypothetical protein